MIWRIRRTSMKSLRHSDGKRRKFEYGRPVGARYSTISLSSYGLIVRLCSHAVQEPSPCKTSADVLRADLSRLHRMINDHFVLTSQRGFAGSSELCHFTPHPGIRTQIAIPRKYSTKCRTLSSSIRTSPLAADERYRYARNTRSSALTSSAASAIIFWHSSTDRFRRTSAPPDARLRLS